MLDAGHNDLSFVPLIACHNQGDIRLLQTHLKKAIDEVKKGVSQREVCKMYNIPRSTLQNKLKGAHSLNPGRRTVLSADEEKSIVDHVICVANWGFPLDSLGQLSYLCS